LGKSGPGKVSPTKISSGEVSSAKIGFSEIGSAKISMTEVDPSQIKLAEISSMKINSIKIRLYASMFFSPFVPNIYSLLEKIKVLLIYHIVHLFANDQSYQVPFSLHSTMSMPVVQQTCLSA